MFLAAPAGLLLHRPAPLVQGPDARLPDLRAIERGRVLKAAERYLSEQPITITAFSSPRSAGGAHDFFSEGDYWWPDPAESRRPLHSARRDDQPGQLRRSPSRLMRLSLQVPALAAAWKLTNDRRYAEHAARHLRAWFVDDETRMNPHLLYAQAIKGRVTGRGIGIIDTIHLVEVARAIAALDACGGAVAGGRQGIREWFVDYLDVDDDARVRPGGARREEQSRHVLGDAGRRVRALHGTPRPVGVLSRAFQDRAGAQSDGRRRQLPGGAAAHEALRVFALQSRCVGDNLSR